MVQFLSMLEPRYFKDNQVIFRTNDEVHEFYMIADGQAEVGFFNEYFLEESNQPKYIYPIKY